MEALLKDIRYSYRTLLKNPGFAAVAILTLALGVGACTAIFSIVDAVLLRPLPYPESERIVQLREVSEKGTQMAFAEPNFLDLRERATSLEGAAQYSGGIMTITGGSEPVRARTFSVSADFFRVLGTPPALGRVLGAEESRAGAEPAAVVSYGFWQRQLAGTTELAGTVLKIDDRNYSVIGVMPAEFNFPQSAEVWIARELFPAQISRSAHNWSVVARVKQGTALEAARAEISNIARQLKEASGQDMDGVDFALVPQHEYMVGSVETVLGIILVAVAFLLLVACTNVANLLLGPRDGAAERVRRPRRAGGDQAPTRPTIHRREYSAGNPGRGAWDAAFGLGASSINKAEPGGAAARRRDRR